MTDLTGTTALAGARARIALRAAGAAEVRFFAADLRVPAESGALALGLCAPVAHNGTGTAIRVAGGWTAHQSHAFALASCRTVASGWGRINRGTA